MAITMRNRRNSHVLRNRRRDEPASRCRHSSLGCCRPSATTRRSQSATSQAKCQLRSPARSEAASLEFALKAASLEVTDDISDKDEREIEAHDARRSARDGRNYPEIVFRKFRAQCGQDQRRAISHDDLNGESDAARRHSRLNSSSAYVTAERRMLRALRRVLDTADRLSKSVRLSVAGGTLKLKDD